MRRALLCLVCVAVAGCAGERSSGVVAPGSTRAATLVDRDGDGALETGPAEPLLDRGGQGRVTSVVATFAQIADAHVRDEESPARVPFLDRYGEPFESTFRPHEALLPHVLAASVRALNAERPQAVIETGDLVDSAQGNELEQALAALDGGHVLPDSGAAGYDGVQDADSPDPLYYRPDFDAPRHPRMLDRAQRPFASAGLRAPWYPVLGNHDLLVAGEVAPSARIDAVAAGGRLVSALPPDVRVPRGIDPRAAVRFLLEESAFGRRRSTPADPERRPLRAAGVLARLARSGAAAPARRAAAAVAGGRLDYAFDVDGMRAIALDTVARGGGSSGADASGAEPLGSSGADASGAEPLGSSGADASGAEPLGSSGADASGAEPLGSSGADASGAEPLGSSGADASGAEPLGSSGADASGAEPLGSSGADASGAEPLGSAAAVGAGQRAWLRAELARAGGRPVVVFSHHALPEPALRLLDAAPGVVAAVSGHAHRNRITPRGRYWLVSTASLADHPQQARMFRLARTAAGGLAIETWMVDHDGRGLAGVARELAFLDAQGGRPQGFAGARGDRNARLFVPAR